MKGTFIIITVVLAIAASIAVIGALESASATRATRDETIPRRNLEIGWIGKTLLAAVFFGVFIGLAALSKWVIVSTVIGLILSIALVLFNVYAKGNGVNMFYGLAILWIGIVCSSLYGTKLTTMDWYAWFYVIFQIALLLLLVFGTALGNINAYRRQKLAKANSESGEQSSDDESDIATNDTENDEDDEEEPTGPNLFFDRAIKVGALAILIMALVVIGFFAEFKWDFFPPYRF